MQLLSMNLQDSGDADATEEKVAMWMKHILLKPLI